MLALLCFCVAAEFSVNKDLYINEDDCLESVFAGKGAVLTGNYQMLIAVKKINLSCHLL